MSKLFYPLEEKDVLKRGAYNKSLITLIATLGISWVLSTGAANNPTGNIGLVAAVGVGLCFWIWALSDYARSKGYPGSYGFLGLSLILGWFILLALPDQWGKSDAPKMKLPSKMTW